MSTGVVKQKWYRDNLERISNYNKQYRMDNPKKYLLRKAANNAKQTGREFNLTEEDINIPDVCPVLGIPLKTSTGDNSPSLDRLDNTKGYIKGNVNVISWKANKLKGCASLEDLKKIVLWIENFGK